MKQWLNQISMRGKLGILTVVNMAGLLLIALFLAYQQYQQSLLDRKLQVRHAVEAASGVLAWASQQEGDGALSRQQAQALARSAVAKMRYGDNE